MMDSYRGCYIKQGNAPTEAQKMRHLNWFQQIIPPIGLILPGYRSTPTFSDAILLYIASPDFAYSQFSLGTGSGNFGCRALAVDDVNGKIYVGTRNPDLEILTFNLSTLAYESTFTPPLGVGLGYCYRMIYDPIESCLYVGSDRDHTVIQRIGCPNLILEGQLDIGVNSFAFAMNSSKSTLLVGSERIVKSVRLSDFTEFLSCDISSLCENEGRIVDSRTSGSMAYMIVGSDTTGHLVTVTFLPSVGIGVNLQAVAPQCMDIVGTNIYVGHGSGLYRYKKQLLIYSDNLTGKEIRSFFYDAYRNVFYCQTDTREMTKVTIGTPMAFSTSSSAPAAYTIYSTPGHGFEGSGGITY